MQVKTVSYKKLFSLGNFQNEQIGVEIEIQPGDDVQKALQDARQFVEFNHKVNGLITERDKCEFVVKNPDDFTGSQVKRAMERMAEIDEMITTGQKLLIN